MPAKKKVDIDIEGVSPEELREYKDELISKIYHDEDKGYKSKAKTYAIAHEKNPIITKKEVEDWFRNNGVAQKPRSFKNSYVAEAPLWEYRWIS